MKKAILTDIIAALFILLFVYAATSKLIDYTTFKNQLRQSPMFPDFSNAVAFIVPFAEFVIAGLLIKLHSRLLGLYAAFTLMVVFVAYIIAITNFSEYIPCSCGGILTNMDWSQHLIFNIFFLLMAGAGIISYPIIQKCCNAKDNLI